MSNLDELNYSQGIVINFNVSKPIDMGFLRDRHRLGSSLCKKAKNGDVDSVRKLKEEFRCKVYTKEELEEYGKKKGVKVSSKE